MKPSLILLLACASLLSQTEPTDIPGELKVNDNEMLKYVAHSKGDQIYYCSANANGAQYGYILRAPEAVLTDDAGKEVGRHLMGPIWQWSDGSRVKGKVLVGVPSPAGNSIPWLLLSGSGQGMDGAMSHVTSILRLHTTGGRAPSSGCDADHLNQQVRVPYTADYYFYIHKPAPPRPPSPQ
jgi:Protein of unknown function (DUF3455)